MAILNVRDVGSIGVISDIAPWDLPPSALSDGINFRASAGKIVTCGGLRDAAGGDTGDVLGHIAQSTDLDKNSLWLLLGEKSIKAFDGQTVENVDNNLTFPPGGVSSPEKWSHCQIGAMVFLNHPEWYPIYWEDREGLVEQANMLPWSPTQLWSDLNYSCKVLRAHKNFLFALGMSEDGDVYSDKVRWSHPAEPNGIPYTWETPLEDRSSIAGYVTLGRGGSIVGGESLRDSFVIYSDEAINAFDYVGDALGWRRRQISASAGLAGKESVVEVGGMHYFISRDDILVFDGNSVRSLLHNKLRSRMARSINNEARANAWAAHNQIFNEIWFAIPEGLNTYPNVVYVYNYRDDTWAIRELGAEFRHGHFGNQPTKFDYRIWDSGTDAVWDEGQSSWHLFGDQPFDGIMYGVEGQRLHNLDPQKPETLAQSYIQRTDMPIGGHEANTTITRIYPLIEGTGVVQMRFGSQQRAGGPVRWASDYIDFRPGEDRKIDIRTTGELHAYEVRTKENNFFSLTGFDVEYSLAGAR